MPSRSSSALGALLLLAACRPPPARTVARPAAPADGPRVGEAASNILRADYAGSLACQKCHAEIYGKWFGSPMHHMTRIADDATVHAPFAGEQFRFKDDLLRMETHEKQRYMRLFSGGQEHLYRVTKVIGGHHREDFAGVEVQADAPGLPPIANARDRILPATFAIGAAAWRYKGYSVMTLERPGLRPGAVWSQTCIFCHNTEPYLSDLFGALAGPSTPAYQGEVVDPLLPPDRRYGLRVTDERALARAIGDEVKLLTGKPPVREDAALAVKATRALFDQRHLVEVGIGCEACHGGSAEHVRHPGVSPVYEPRSPFVEVVAPALDVEALRAQRITRTCARCHQVLFTKYPWTWEGGRRNDSPPGGSHINSGEARDFLLGACATRMSCITCHDPHAPDNREKMAKLDGPEGSAICQKCHPKYATPDAVRAHAHHDPAGAGGQCMGCHFPKKNMSLDNRLGRYHRVGSPDDPQKVERDRPLECALCHADKSVAELIDAMEGWWGKRYDRAALTRLYGSLSANVMRETLRAGKPHEQASALAILGDTGDRAALPLIAAQLTHPYPLLRYFAARALEQLTGRPLAIDLFQRSEAIRSQAAALTGVAITPGRAEPAPAEGEE